MADHVITDVVYEKGTHRMIMFKRDDMWVLPNEWALAHFQNGAYPVLVADDDGAVFSKPNAIIVKDYLN